MDPEPLAVTLIIFGSIVFNIWFAWAVYYRAGKKAMESRSLY